MSAFEAHSWSTRFLFGLLQFFTIIMPEHHLAALDPDFLALVRTRHAGNPRAMAELGARLLTGRDAPCSPVNAVALITEAAQQDDATAWRYLALLSAVGAVRQQSWADALQALQHAAALGDGDADRQVLLLHEAGIDNADDIVEWLTVAAQGRVLCASPRIVACSGFLPLAWCEYLISCAMPRLAPAEVYDVQRGQLKIDPMRTNTRAPFLLLDSNLILQLARTALAQAAGTTVERLEPLEILHYSPGESYRPHVDAFNTEIPKLAEHVRQHGQRVSTGLIYLNEGYEGGETDFPRINVRYAGRAGDGLVFWNVDDQDALDLRTVHEGRATTHGEKWLLSQWMRDKVQPPG